MRHSKPWDRVLWGVVYARPLARPNSGHLIGSLWHRAASRASYAGEPTRALVFQSRSQARDWLASYNAGIGGQWRMRVVKVREAVTVLS